MPATPIRATDAMTIHRPVGEVWPVLVDLAGYPRWWPKRLGVRVVSGGDEPLGTEVEIRPPGGRPFRCRVVAVDEQRRIRLQYGGGFVDGCGEWLLEPMGEATRVTYRLDARAHGWLACLLGKVIDFGSVHSRSMRDVLDDLDRVVRQGPRVAGEGR